MGQSGSYKGGGRERASNKVEKKGSNAKIEWESKKRKVISELTQSQLKKRERREKREERREKREKIDM